MKKSYIIEKLINKHIKKGDKVRLIDGSGLTNVINDNNEPTMDFYIVNSYPEQTGYKEILKEIDCVVLQTNIKNRIVNGALNYAYLQDVIIQCGTSKFRTCSKFLTKI